MEFYIMVGDQRTGPFTEEEIRTKTHLGELDVRALVWHKGLDKWRPCGNVFTDMPELVSWFARVGDRHVGPMTPSAFQHQVEAGQITADTLVWRSGMPSWRRLDEVPEALPPLSCTGFDTGMDTGLNPTFNVDPYLSRPTPKPALAQSGGLLARFDGIPPPFNYGGFWRRFVAVILDGFFLWVILLVIMMAFSAFFAGIAGMMAGPNPSNGEAMAVFSMAFSGMVGLFLAMLLIAFLYPVLTTWWLGGTLGKLACGLRVVCSNGDALSFPRCVARGLARHFISNSLTFGIGDLLAAFTLEKKALHDMMCNTRVVKNR